MRRRPDRLAALALLAPALALGAGGEAARGSARGAGTPFDAASFGRSKEPITITADRLEYDYKANVVVYRGDVIATQGETKVRSDTMTVTFAARGDAPPAGADPPDPNARGQQRLQEVVAVGKVRIDNGTRWATGGRAVFEQGNRTVVLTEDPVLHDGPNEVAGERVIVYLDENRSEVVGGRKRVKAVVYPSKDESLTAAAPPRGGAGADAAKQAASSLPAPAATP